MKTETFSNLCVAQKDYRVALKTHLKKHMTLLKMSDDDQVHILEITDSSTHAFPSGKYTWKGVLRISSDRLNSHPSNPAEEIRIVFDKPTNTVVVLDVTPRCSDVITAIHKHFPTDATLMMASGVQSRDMNAAKALQNIGFDLKLHGNHPLGLNLSGTRLWGTRQNNLRQLSNSRVWLAETDDYCQAIVSLTEDTVKQLWKLVSKPIEMDIEGKDGDVVEESMAIEMAGQLDARRVDEGHYELTLNQESLTPGDHTEVTVAEGVYNFHTHPTGIYKLYGLTIGIPSNQDYVGFLAAVHEYNTVMHLVLSREGIYYLSLSPEFVPYIGVMDDDFADRILDEFPDCLRRKGFTGKQINERIQSYLKHINSIECLGIRVFVLTFQPWSLATTERRVVIPKLPTGECIYTQHELNTYRKLHGRKYTELFGIDDPVRAARLAYRKKDTETTAS